MSRGTRISTTVKHLIIDEALKNRDEPRRATALKVTQLLEDIGEAVPSLETLEKIISWARNQPDPEDNPWSVLNLTRYDIPSETLPIVLEVWSNVLKTERKPLSIRQAKWVARLSRTVTDLETLYWQAALYAAQERAAIMLGTKDDLPLRMIGFNKDVDLYSEMTGKTPPHLESDKTRERLGLIWEKKEARHERSHNQAVQE